MPIQRDSMSTSSRWLYTSGCMIKCHLDRIWPTRMRPTRTRRVGGAGLTIVPAAPSAAHGSVI